MKIPDCQTCRRFLATFIALVIVLLWLAYLSQHLPVLPVLCLGLVIPCGLCVLLILTRPHL